MNNLFTILLSVLFLMFTGVFEQAQSQSPINIGVKGGVNIASFIESDNDYETLTAYTAGLSLDFSIPTLPIGVESGVYFSQKGATSTGNVKFNVDYIEVPVLVKYAFLPGPISPHILLGPYAGYVINTSSRGSTFTNLQTLDDYTNEIDFGAIAGIGVDLNVAFTKLNIQGRYSYGLSSVFDEDFDGDAKNGVISIVAGIVF